jgi:hypothetical protein
VKNMSPTIGKRWWGYLIYAQNSRFKKKKEKRLPNWMSCVLGRVEFKPGHASESPM